MSNVQHDHCRYLVLRCYVNRNLNKIIDMTLGKCNFYFGLTIVIHIIFSYNASEEYKQVIGSESFHFSYCTDSKQKHNKFRILIIYRNRDFTLRALNMYIFLLLWTFNPTHISIWQKVNGLWTRHYGS